MAKIMSQQTAKNTLMKGYRPTFAKTVGSNVRVFGYAKKGSGSIIVTKFPKGAMKVTKTYLVSTKTTKPYGPKTKRSYKKSASSFRMMGVK